MFQPFKVDTTERGARTDSRKGYLAAQLRTVSSDRFAWQARGSWLRTRFADYRRTATDASVANRFGLEVRAEAHPDAARTVLVGGEATLSDVASDIFGNHSQSEFAAYGHSLERSRDRIAGAAEWLRDLGIGGTAVGTGLNAEPE